MKSRKSLPVTANTVSRRGEGPHPIDIHVGARLRLRRTLLGLSQEKLGEAVGITFQQLQKYERGANRISASRLYHLAQVLDVPVGFFFEDMPIGQPAAEGARVVQLPTETDEFESMAKRETLELVRAYYRIGDPNVRRRAFELIKALGGERDDED
ncbi:helix-turn-helix transcriptional regulator [Arenibaculum sp.]|jgi:transcriptional regulator with XRE-family HTH domain|uniref:helix-turn-helix domain-containing protein n=1 Tax=Arenibaculum sp. TaxID=2865862 RepID=UPI002E11B03B|nr:helix-turn-helix transcriptional regulator [Arenibaculum sp.]